MMKVEKIIECSQRYGFIKAVRSSTAEKRPHWFHYGPAGEILVQNLQREWVFSTISARESTNVFQHCSPGPAKDVSRLKDAYEGCKYLTNGQLPFGLVENRTSDEQCEPEVPKNDCCEHLPKKCQPLIYYAFVSHQVGVQFFYRWQQHRLMWWRKFAMDPGRFTVTEAGKEGKVDILAKFPWGSTILETITNRGSDFFGNLPPQQQAHFEVMDGRKRGLPYVVESVCTVEAATFTYLCDGFSEFESREQFHLHRRLAPFKISFAAAPTSSQGSEELTELTVYLGQELRRVGIITLLPQINNSLESQLSRCDSLAVPYTLILTTATLVTGIAMLRSQQTSLVEEIHVSQVVSYVEQLMRNY